MRQGLRLWRDLFQLMSKDGCCNCLKQLSSDLSGIKIFQKSDKRNCIRDCFHAKVSDKSRGRKLTHHLKKIVPIEDQFAALQSWQGAYAKVWMFHVSHNRLAIHLSKKNETHGLYIFAISCEYISGNLGWDNSSISLSIEYDSFNEKQCKIIDERNHFEIRCSDVILASGPCEVPSDPFDKFLGE
jgi:hypothetical protein